MPAVLCSKCATDLPDGAQFCLKCGEPVKAPADAPPATAILGCSKCGTSLPDGAEFCPRCGKPVSMPAKALPKSSAGVLNSQPVDAKPIEPIAEPTSQSARNIRRVVLFGALGIIVLAIIWVAASDNPFAQGVQEGVGWKHDQAILDSPFSVSAHTFRYYKFALPEGSMHVAIVGEFSSAADPTSRPKGTSSENNIEVYVLSEPAFTVWQNGYGASSVYESGRVAKGHIESDLPDGAGIYYLVFSNKFSPGTPKHVDASVLLRYKNWLPESLRHAKDRFWNWLGM